MNIIGCPHVEERERNSEGSGWILAAQDGMIVFLDSEQSTSLQLCPVCAGLVRDKIFNKIVNDTFQQVLRNAAHSLKVTPNI